MGNPQARALLPDAAEQCADYILGWMRRRNCNELDAAFDGMRVGDARLMRAELVNILMAGGKPENWER